ncbi:hypothetical protein A2884_02105 [Candidatus Saccharibacteria bacterium RIFCSPHIGHO2_01_FULL_48_12]|nr:MAG: hypothetical protein A2884_02105 [Candidatus Saccharibacteria bacterium RIFCSPHIGHO2_01_FULL_48_12]OGL34942.1 MAG: hypothetical protein A3F38_02355 [Candidatus Saccharibacteria bacterium RIFCSPHIGHO2_12_FULL_48_21]
MKIKSFSIQMQCKEAASSTARCIDIYIERATQPMTRQCAGSASGVPTLRREQAGAVQRS